EPSEETGVRLLGKNLSALPSLSQEAQSFLAKGFESRSSEPSSLAEMQAKAPALIAEFEIHQKEAMRVVDHFESMGIEGQPSLARSLQSRLEMPSLSLRLVAMEIQSEKSHPEPNTERLEDLRALRQYVQAKRLESESTAALLLLESPQGLAQLRQFEEQAQALTDEYGVAYKSLEPQLTRIKTDLGALLQNAPQSAQELQTFEKSYLALCAKAAPIEEKLAKHVQAQADVKVAIDTTLATYEQHIAQGSPMGKALKESGVVELLKAQQNVINETFKASLDELVQLRESQVQVEAVGGELVLRQHIRPTLNVALERAGLSTVQEGDHRAFQTQVDALRKKLGVHKERLENTSAGQQAGVLLQEIETQDQVRAYLQRFGKSSQDDLGPLGQAGNVDALTAELSAKGLKIEAPSEGMSRSQALLSAARRYETSALLEVAGLGRPNLADAMAVEKTTEALGKVLELTPEEQAALETLEPMQRLEALVGKLSAQYEGAAQVAASILVGRLHVPPEKLDRSGFPVGAAIVAQLKRHVEGGLTPQNKTLFPITPLTPQEARELCGFLEQPPVLSAEPSAFVETVLRKMEALNRFSAQDVNDLESILYRHGKGNPLSFAQVKRMLSDVNLPASDRQSLAPLVQRGAAGLEPSELFKSLDVAGSSAKYVPRGNWDNRFVSLKDLGAMRGLVFANEALPDSALPLGLLRADMLINARKLDHHLSQDTEDFYSVRNAIKGAYADPYTKQERRLLNALYQKQPHAKGKSLHASVEDSFASGWFGSREFAAKRGELLNLIDRPSVEDWASRYEPGQLNANDTPYAFASRIAEYYGVDPKRPDQIVQASQASRSTGGSCLLYDDEIADAIEDWNDDGRSPRISKNQPSLADIERLYRNDYYEPSSARHKENFRLLKRSHDETQRALQQYFKASAAKDERAAQKHYDQAVKSYSEHWIVGRTYSASQSAYMDQYISNLEDGMTVARYTRDGAILIGTTIATAGAGTAVVGAGLFARTGIALSAGVGFGTATSLASRGVEEAGHAISGQGASWNRFAEGMGSDLKMVGQTAAFTAVPVGIYGKLGQMASGGSNFAKAAVQGVVGQRLTAAGMNTALDMGSHYVNQVFHPESAQAKDGYSAKRGLFVAGVGAVFGTTNFGLASRGSRTAQTADYVLDVVSVGIEGYGVEAVEGRAGQFDPQAALNILAVRLATRQKAVRDVGGSPGAKKTSVESTPVRDVVPPAARKNGWSDAVLDLAVAKGYAIDMGGRPPADLVFKAIENEARLDGGLKTKAEPAVESSKVFSTESVDAEISALVALRGQRKNTQGKLNDLSKDALAGSVSEAQVKSQLDALRTTLRAEESSTLRLEKDLRQIEVLAKDENQRTSVAEYKRNLTATDKQAAAQLTAFREFYDAGQSAFAQRLTGQGVLDADVAGVSPRVAMAIQHRMQSKHSSVDMQGAANVEHLSTVLDGNLRSEAQRLGRSLKQSEVDQIALETVLTDAVGKGRSPKDLADMPIAPLKDAQGNILRTGGEFWESAYKHQLDQAYKDPNTFAGIKDTDQAVVKQTIDALAKDTGGLMPFELQPRLKEMVKAGKLSETQSAKVAEIWGKTFLAEPFQAGTLLHGVPDYQGVRETVLLAGGDEGAAMRAYEATLGHHMAGFVAHGFAKAGVEPNFKALGKDSGGPLTTAMAKQLHDFYKSSIDLAGKWRPIIENAKPALTKAQRAEYFKDAQQVRTHIETMPEH
ncbi:MAG: hypothetical protein QGI45_13830, partial [Myxococcota bacterium]|nr:hypothetical protein [Myxococcota bacterium]